MHADADIGYKESCTAEKSIRPSQTHIPHRRLLIVAKMSPLSIVSWKTDEFSQNYNKNSPEKSQQFRKGKWRVTH